jgi:hypothetical protein
MRRRRSDIPIHLALVAIAAMTLLPFIFVINNSMRRTSEQYHSFFGVPASVQNLVRFTWFEWTDQKDRIQLRLVPEGRTESPDRSAPPMSRSPSSPTARRCPIPGMS